MTDPSPNHDGFGPVTAITLSRVQQVVGKRLQAAWTQVPQVTHLEEADVTSIDALRREPDDSQHDQPTRLSLLAYVARSCVLALREFPRFCASLDADGKTLWLKQYINLGIAVDTPMGLLVPVISAAADKSVTELSGLIAQLAARARGSALAPTELEGACLTVSSLGKWGGLGFSPIVNTPNLATLGVGEARMKPQWIDGAVVPRLMLPFSLSYDHRVINGVDAGRFCAFIRDCLSDPQRF